MLRIFDKLESEIDGIIKIVWESETGKYFESVCVPFENKGIFTVCVSSQAGCHLKCKICETAGCKYGADINLTAQELTEEATRTIETAKNKFPKLEFDEIAFMGMGEPFLNIDNLIESVDELMLSGYNVAISTVGILSALKKFVKYEFKKYPRLQISLHKLKNREKIIPSEIGNPIEEILKIAIDYSIKASLPLTLNWVLLKGVNDSEDEAIKIGQTFDPQVCRINITNYIGDRYECVSEDDKNKFISQIKKSSAEKYSSSIEVNSFKVLGADIKAGCGQLVGEHKEKLLK